jgi:hypothetical protein
VGTDDQKRRQMVGRKNEVDFLWIVMAVSLAPKSVKLDTTYGDSITSGMVDAGFLRQYYLNP